MRLNRQSSQRRCSDQEQVGRARSVRDSRFGPSRMRKLELVIGHDIEHAVDKLVGQLQRQRIFQDRNNASKRLGNDLRRRLDVRGPGV
jgi:hypothetical protein